MKGATAVGVVGLSGLVLGLGDFSTPVDAAGRSSSTKTTTTQTSSLESSSLSTDPVEWSSITRAPFILVTPQGPADGGNYGSGTPGTATNGIQEAIDAAPEQATVCIAPGVQTSPSTNITINKNINLIGLYSGGHNGAYSTPEENEVSLGNLNIAATTETLYKVWVQGVYVMGVLTISANPYDTNRLLFQNCYFQGGVVHESAASVNSDSTVYENCWITNTTPYGKAAPSNGIATYTVTSSGDNNVNQTFFNNCAIEAPYAASGDIFHFLVNGANFYPVLTGCQLHIPQTMTSGIGTIFKLRGSGVILDAAVGQQYTEFHSPMQIVEALSADCTDPQIVVDWSSYLNILANGNNLINLTASSSEYGSIKLRGNATYGVTCLPGTLLGGGISVDIHVPLWSTSRWNMTTPILPTSLNKAVVNATTQKQLVYQIGGSGIVVTDVFGTSRTLSANPPTVELAPFEAIAFSGAVPTGWQWCGVQ